MRGRGQKIKGNFLNAKDAKKLPREFKKKFNLENPPIELAFGSGVFLEVLPRIPRSLRAFRVQGFGIRKLKRLTSPPPPASRPQHRPHCNTK